MIKNQQNPLLGKIAAYTEILAADPLSTIFVSLSESYRKMGMLDEALTVALKGLGHLPDYGPGHIVVARIKCQQDDMAASEASFKKALDIDPDSLAGLVGFSRLYLLLGETVKARNLLLTARELSPADSVINKLLLTLPEVEDVPEVTAEISAPVDVAFEATTVSHVEPLETATLADLYLKQGMADQALNIYRNLLTRDPDNLDFRRCIRDIELILSGSTADSVEIIDSVDLEVDSDFDASDTVDNLTTVSVVEEMTPSVLPVDEMSVLARLNCLLTSVQKRRGDV